MTDRILAVKCEHCGDRSFYSREEWKVKGQEGIIDGFCDYMCPFEEKPLHCLQAYIEHLDEEHPGDSPRG